MLLIDSNPIYTDRCPLSSVQRSDGEDVVRLYQDIRVRKYLGDVTAQSVAWERFRSIMECGASRHWVARRKIGSEFVGLISIGRHHDGTEYELSYQFSPEYWGKGIAKEAIQLLVSQKFIQSVLSSLVAKTQIENDRSIKLLKKIGFLSVNKVPRFDKRQIIYKYSCADR